LRIGCDRCRLMHIKCDILDLPVSTKSCTKCDKSPDRTANNRYVMTQANGNTDLSPPRAYKQGQTRMAQFFLAPPLIKTFHTRLSTSPQDILTINQMAPTTKGNSNTPEKYPGSSQEKTTKSTSPIKPKRESELTSIIPSISLCCAFTISPETSLYCRSILFQCCRNATTYSSLFNCPLRVLFPLTLKGHLDWSTNPAAS